ncbi:MAG: cytochrome C, partial [Bacteroidota bacterium]|nr:cytochrome C [Bacteroidota bacterium]
DVAAYINSQPRPHFNQQSDWKDIRQKPLDFPFVPYSDSFSQKQHKYGPFKPIKAAHEQTNKNHNNKPL